MYQPFFSPQLRCNSAKQPIKPISLSLLPCKPPPSAPACFFDHPRARRRIRPQALNTTAPSSAHLTHPPAFHCFPGRRLFPPCVNKKDMPCFVFAVLVWPPRAGRQPAWVAGVCRAAPPPHASLFLSGFTPSLVLPKRWSSPPPSIVIVGQQRSSSLVTDRASSNICAPAASRMRAPPAASTLPPFQTFAQRRTAAAFTPSPPLAHTHTHA